MVEGLAVCHRPLRQPPAASATSPSLRDREDRPCSRARAFYETFIRRGEDVVAEIRSSWCCLDARTRRPTRPAREVIERFLSGK